MTSPLKRPARVIAAGAALALALAACSDEPEQITLPSPSPEASESAEPEPTTEPSPEDPFAVPAEIDAAYVERVLNEINRLDGEMTREILRTDVNPEATELPSDIAATLDSLYGKPIRTFSGNAALDLVRSTEPREELFAADEYGQVTATVEAVLITSPCVVARIDRDYTTTDADLQGTKSGVGFAFLQRDEAANTTGWRLLQILGADVSPGSEGEQELRAVTAKDLEPELPSACQ